MSDLSPTSWFRSFSLLASALLISIGRFLFFFYLFFFFTHSLWEFLQSHNRLRFKVSWGFWLLSCRDPLHTHKHRKRNREHEVSERGGECACVRECVCEGGGATGQTLTHSWLMALILSLLPSFFSLLFQFFSPLLLFVVSRAILSKHEQPHLWSKLSGFD